MKKIYLIISLLIIIIIAIFFFKNSERKIHIELGIYSGNDWNVPQQDVYKIFDESIKEFERQNSNIEITYRSGTLREDYSEWLAQKILTGNEPDVFIVVEEDFNTLASIGMLENLTGFIKEDSGFNKKDYYEKAFDSGQFEGYQFGLPFQVVPTFMIVNKTLLKNEGISISSDNLTWDEFYKICKKVTKDKDSDGIMDQFGVQGFEWEQALYANGQSIFDSQGKNLAYTDNAMEETLKLLFNINQINKGKIVEEHDFERGNVAFKPFSLAEYRAYKPYPYSITKYANFEWKAIKFPDGPSGRSKAKLYTVQMSMGSRSKEKNATWSFMHFLTNNENIQQKVWNYTYTLPSNRKVVEDIYYKMGTKNHIDVHQDILEPHFLQNIIEESVAIPRFKRFEDIKKQMNAKIYPVIMGSQPINEGVRDLKRSTIKQINSYNPEK